MPLEMKPTRNMPVKKIFTGTLISVAIFILFFVQIQTVHASLFSFFAGLVAPGPVSADIQASSSDSSSTDALDVETMPLLQAASNLNPNPDNCSDVSPINGTILDPSIASTNQIGDCAALNSSPNTDIGTYTVQPGDTISSIAAMFDISQDTIKQANNLTSSVVRVGQVLTILPRSGIIYIVKKGDTLSAIAHRYHADTGDILEYNDIASSSLIIGTAIMIPDAEPLPSDFVQPGSAGVNGSGSLSGSRYAGISYPHLFPHAFELELDNISDWPRFSGAYSCPLLPGVGRLSQGLHSHDAVDLAAPLGTPIHAFADGTVIIDKMNNGWNGGYGNYIVISHSNGSQTLYAHMEIRSKGLVSVGEPVSEGQVIGYIGMTGLTTGPHVHFEVRGAQNPCLSYR
jgi:murein DD-endopeptidase MepM/ murein hydrolase activator NlpD